MKEKTSQHKIFKADPAKVKAYQLLGDEYDFQEDTQDAERLADKLRKHFPSVTVKIRSGKVSPQQQAAWEKLARRLLCKRNTEDEEKDNKTKRTYSPEGQSILRRTLSW